MEMKQRLLARLEAVALAVKETGQGVAVLGLGSVGQELDRLDAYSDLDFFVIARPGQKRYFLDSLFWLENIQPILFSFLNTAGFCSIQVLMVVLFLARTITSLFQHED